MTNSDRCRADVLKIGDTVVWRGAWGTGPRQEAIVTAIEVTAKGEKYGHSVNSIEWTHVRSGLAVVTLANGHWAYAYQIEPLILERR